MLNSVPFVELLSEHIGIIGFLVLIFEQGLSCQLCGKLDETSISIVAAVVLSVAGNILLCALALVSFGIPPAESSLAATSLATMIFDIADTGWFDIKTRDSASGFKKEDGRLSAMVSVHLIPLPAPKSLRIGSFVSSSF